MKIYTKRGDQGETDLYDGSRVSKTSKIIGLIGEVDELISNLGIIYFKISEQEQIQSTLMCLNTWLATPKPKSTKQKKQISYKPDLYNLESKIDLLSKDINIKYFILPAHPFHILRCKVRRVERKFWKLKLRKEKYKPNFLEWGKYLNRLSDYFYVLALTLQVASKHELKKLEHP